MWDFETMPKKMLRPIDQKQSGHMQECPTDNNIPFTLFVL